LSRKILKLYLFFHWLVCHLFIFVLKYIS